MIAVILISILLLIGGGWLYQRQAPSDTLTANQEALVREDSLKVVAPNEKLVVVEFADYQCPACASVAPKVKEFKETYKDNVTFVYRDFPLTGIHPNAVKSAQMARIAGEQGKYWEMHDLLFAKQGEWELLPDPSDVFIAYAGTLGMATSSIKAKLASDIYIDKIQADVRDGELVGVNSTPTFFVGNKIIRTANYVALKNEIDAALANAQ